MPVPSDVDQAASLAGDLLGTLQSSLAVIGEEPVAYLYPGQPPVDVGEPDCQGMLAVYVAGMGRTPLQMERGAPANALTFEARGPRVPLLTLSVVYARCATVWGDEAGEIPPPDVLTAEAFGHARAGWAMMNGVVSAVANGRLFSRCRTFTVSDLVPLAVSGETAGWSFTVTVQTGGYDPYDFSERVPVGFEASVSDVSPAN